VDTNGVSAKLEEKGKTAMGNRKTYSEEFKLEALRLESNGRPVAQMERELGLSYGLLRNWRKRYQISLQEDKPVRSEGEQLQAKLRRLQQENAILRQGQGILKKAVQIFS
jgi:transposase